MFKETKQNLDGAFTAIYPFTDQPPKVTERHTTVYVWHEANCLTIAEFDAEYIASEARLLAQALIEAATVLESLRSAE
jgi:hypothetical protein